MDRFPVHSDEAEERAAHPAFRFQRVLLAACIFLTPFCLALYVLSWPVNPAKVVNAAEASFVVTSQMAGPLGNTLHFIGGVLASFLLPAGYVGMSLLGMRRAPWLATVSVVLSFLGWLPWAALMGVDDLAYVIAQAGPTPQLNAIWLAFNGGAVMSAFLFIYIVAHLLASVVIAIMLGRLRIIPAWAAWALALTSPFTMALFVIKAAPVLYVLRTVDMALFVLGMVPAAAAMFQARDLEEPEALSA